MWSQRLARAAAHLGWEASITADKGPFNPADVAIVNLGAIGEESGRIVSELHGLGAAVIGHAGHKEKELHQLGESAGCDLLVTNRELTVKLAELLDRAAKTV